MCIEVRVACILLATDVSEMEKAELHSYRLMEKYATIWKKKTEKCEHAWRNHFYRYSTLFICCEYSLSYPPPHPVSQFHSTLKQVSWLRSMLFNVSSQSARRATATMLASLAHGEARQRQILDLLCR